MLFHKYIGSKVGVKNSCHDFQYSSKPSPMLLDNGNTGHAQLIRIILCCFIDFPIVYPAVTVYYWPGHPSNTISLGSLKCYVGFKNVTSESL